MIIITFILAIPHNLFNNSKVHSFFPYPPRIFRREIMRKKDQAKSWILKTFFAPPANHHDVNRRETKLKEPAFEW